MGKINEQERIADMIVGLLANNDPGMIISTQVFRIMLQQYKNASDSPKDEGK